MGNLHRIVYLSRSLLTGSPADLETKVRRILATARINNRKHRLTGALAFNEHGFGQVLEGSPDDLALIFGRIRQDPRHCDVKILVQAPAEKRLFPSWSMAFAKGSAGQNDHPLAHFAFEAALTDGATPEAETLLGALLKVVTQTRPAPV
jgi:hypothetical protein